MVELLIVSEPNIGGNIPFAGERNLLRLSRGDFKRAVLNPEVR